MSLIRIRTGTFCLISLDLLRTKNALAQLQDLWNCDQRKQLGTMNQVDLSARGRTTFRRKNNNIDCKGCKRKPWPISMDLGWFWCGLGVILECFGWFWGGLGGLGVVLGGLGWFSHLNWPRFTFTPFSYRSA